jgi:hypothetical protein
MALIIATNNGHNITAIPKRYPTPSVPSYSSAQKKAQATQQSNAQTSLDSYYKYQQQLQNQLYNQANAYQKQLQQRAQKARQQYLNKLDQLLASYQPVEIPTFSASYYRPNQTLKQINRVSKQKPKVNNKQLKQIAKNQVNLLTNPQIETLRGQINELSKLSPKIRKQILQDYSQAQQQLIQNTQNMIAQITQNVEQQVGLRPGVAAAISTQAQKQAHPLVQLLNQSQNNDLNTVIGSLEVQKDNAQALLHSIQKNKKSMTKAQYNALHDQAVQQFKQAQQSQLQLLQQIAQIESGARKSAAEDLQQRAQVRNQTAQQLFGIKSNLLNTWNQSQQQALQNLFQNDQAKLNALQQQNAATLKMYQQQMQQNLANQQQQIQSRLDKTYQNNINQWMDYLTGPTVQTGADAMRRLQQNQAAIEQAVGKDGYLQLYKQLSGIKPGWTNPHYDSTPYYVVPNGATTTNTRAPSPANTGNYYIPPAIKNAGSSILDSILGAVRNFKVF